MLCARRPAPPLSGFIDSLWYCENYQAPHPRERVLPNGAFDLILDLACGAAPLVCGMRTQYVVIETAALRAIMGVLFRPGGARAFFGAPSDDFFNRDVPLDCVWGSGAAAIVERLQDAPTADAKFDALEAAMLARMSWRDAPAHPAVRQALAEFARTRHTAAVAEVARDSGLSRRRLSQLFREQIGIPPKLYCRLRRFQDVVQQIARGGPVDWADVAIAGGYSDQSHFAHEFREFSGITPGAYLAADRPHANHVPID
jgi:AraC-like DNA-binding protein